MEEEFEPPTHRMINGERVELTESEINELLIQWQQERDKQLENLNNE